MPHPEVLRATAAPVVEARSRRRIWLVGPSFRFLSGMSVYTCRLANELAADHDVSVVLLDRLIPRRLYPGARRVGHHLTSLRYDDAVGEVSRLDWYWGTEMARFARILRNDPPEVIVLQWWTAATVHTYLRIARLAAQSGVPVVIEFHEAQDTGEAAVPLVGAYCRRFLRRLIGLASGAILHSEFDRRLLQDQFGPDVLQGLPTRIAPHGPYDHLAPRHVDEHVRDADRPTRVLSFGLIRPYKGVEDLVYALDGMSAAEAAHFDVDIVGETWEGWTLPAHAVAASPHRDRIRFDNRYVTDAEAADLFGRADVLVLPYRRGSASGPLQIAMSKGIFVILYAVGGLVDAVREYDGAILVEPGDIDGLRTALRSVHRRHSERFADPHSWAPLRDAIETLTEARVPA
jgi:glycosyltransferase involved in cell wall biosynthesis